MAKGPLWCNREDLILVKTVTECISKKINTQETFAIASDKLAESSFNRTQSACYGRWNKALEPIYGKAVKLAVQKQQENAQRVVESILENQSPSKVIYEEPLELELVMPFTNSIEQVLSANAFSMNPVVATKTDSLSDTIDFLSNYQSRYQMLEQEYSDALGELEKTWLENDQLKKELTMYQQLDRKYTKFKELVSKFESISV